MIRFLALAVALLAPVALAPAALAQSADRYVVQQGDTLYRISRSNGLTVERLRELNGIEGTTIEVGQTLRLTDRVPRPAPLPRPEAPEPAPDRPAQDRPAQDQPAPARAPAAPSVPVPVTQLSAPRDAATEPVVHVVTAGETLFRIALRYDTSVDELRRLNGVSGDQIEIGQRLVVTTGGPAGGPGRAVALGPARPWSITDTAMPADMVHFVEPGETLYSIASTLGLSADDLARTNALTTAPLRPGTMLRLPEAVNPALAARTDLPPAAEAGLALVYPDVMRGRLTESGEAYDPLAFTLSHREIPFGTVVLVTNPASGRSTFARVIDRGPVSRAYLVELSAAAAEALELDPNAARRVELRRIP